MLDNKTRNILALNDIKEVMVEVMVNVNDTIRMYKNGKITMYKIVHKKYPI